MTDLATTAGDAVVVPGIEPPSSLACLRSLSARDVRTIVVSEDPGTPSFRSAYCDETVAAPVPEDDIAGYGDLLLDLASRSSVQTIIPVREEDVHVLAHRKAEFAEHVATPWPDLDTLESVTDRERLFDAAEDASVVVPETRPLTEWDDWDRDTVIKSRYTVLVENNRASYPSVRYVAGGSPPDVDAVIDEMGHEPIAQEYMPDPSEYAVFALFDEGEPLATFQHKQVRAYKYSGGPSAYRGAVDIPELEGAGIRLLRELDWHGLAMVEFKLDDGVFKLMEINPRFWSSLPFTVQAGVDFPYYYYRLAADGVTDFDAAYEPRTAGHLLRGELGYLQSILTHETPLAEPPEFGPEALKVLKSIARHPRFDYLDRDDPGPFLRDAARMIEGSVRSRL